MDDRKYRDAGTGRYTTEEDAQARPGETVSEAPAGRITAEDLKMILLEHQVGHPCFYQVLKDDLVELHGQWRLDDIAFLINAKLGEK